MLITCNNRSGQELTLADVLVIRPPVDRPITNAAVFAESLAPVYQRVVKLPVHVLGSNDFSICLSTNTHPSSEPILKEDEHPLLVKALREAELAEIAQRTKTIIQADAATIFRTPSKSYCYRFLRTANVQTDRSTLDVFFFWLLPWLRNCGAILAETWSISSVVLNATRLLSRYAPAIGRCKVDMIADYYDRSAESAAAAETALERLVHGTTGDVLVIFSACMTGNAVAGLKELVERRCHPGLSSRLVALYNLRDNLPIEALCNLHAKLPGAFVHYSELPRGSEGVQIIDIDRTTYFPSVVRQIEIGVDRSAAKQAETFFKLYAEADVFSVHRNSYIGGQKVRHHAVYPDVSRLLQNPTFDGKLSSMLAVLEPVPTLVITPPHKTGYELALRAAAVLSELSGRTIPIWQHLDLSFSADLAPPEQQLRDRLRDLREDNAILVVDDVSVTGRRLARYSKSLRDLFRGRIHYVIGLARPEQADDWKRRIRNLKYRDGPFPAHTIASVEFLLLPDWSEDSCPWCAEQALYQRLAYEHGELPAILARRNSALAEAQTSDNPLTQPFVALVGGDVFRLGKNSLFAPAGASAATVFAAVASAVQQLRSRPDAEHNLSVKVYPQVKCVPHSDYLGDTYTDAVLRASLLRSCQRRELERIAPEDEKARADAVRSILIDDDPDQHCLAGELLLGIAMHKVPQIVLSQDDKHRPHLEPLIPILDILLGT